MAQTARQQGRTTRLVHVSARISRCARFVALVVVCALCIAGCAGGDSGAPTGDSTPAAPASASPSPPFAISYESPAILLLNGAINPLRPKVAGSVNNYSVAPTLPAGLLLDSKSGAISGTPVALASAANYVVTAGSIVGSVTATLRISVQQGRTTLDQPDLASSPYQVHAVYAIPTDGLDHGLDVDGTIERSLRSANAWFRGANSGGQGLRLDERLDGSLDVSFYALSQADSTYAALGAGALGAMAAELRASPLYDQRKIFLIYYDGGNSAVCGLGLNGGHFSALFIHGAPRGTLPCDYIAFAAAATSPAGYHEWGAIHEVVHNLGFVQPCARHYNAYDPHHTSDNPADLMWGPSSASDVRVWAPTSIDPDEDDYYGANVPSGCSLNLFASAFLEPSHGNQLPAGF